MHRRTAATRLVTLITLGALAATLVGTVTVQARESRSADRQLRIKGDPARETAGLRTFRKVDVANLPAATGKGSGYDPVLKRPDVNRSPAAPQGGPVPAFPEQATSNGDPAITQATAFPGLAFVPKGATAGEPPDPWVAAGPEHVVQAVNRAFRISDPRATRFRPSTCSTSSASTSSTTRATSSSSIRASSMTAFMPDGSRSRRASTVRNGDGDRDGLHRLRHLRRPGSDGRLEHPVGPLPR